MRSICTVAMAFGALAVATSPSLAADGLLGVKLVERGGKVVIIEVLPNTSAKEVGLVVGDVLLKVGTTEINSLKDALDAKKAASNNEDVPFIVKTPGGPWAINARFEKGKVYSTFTAPKPQPKK